MGGWKKRAAALQPSDDPAKTYGGQRSSRGTEAICASDRPASLAAQPAAGHRGHGRPPHAERCGRRLWPSAPCIRAQGRRPWPSTWALETWWDRVEGWARADSAEAKSTEQRALRLGLRLGRGQLEVDGALRLGPATTELQTGRPRAKRVQGQAQGLGWTGRLGSAGPCTEGLCGTVSVWGNRCLTLAHKSRGKTKRFRVGVPCVLADVRLP